MRLGKELENIKERHSKVKNIINETKKQKHDRESTDQRSKENVSVI